MHTITGSESSSASANAWTWRSTASWFDSAKSWIQPQSRCDITSEWSFQMLIGRADRPVRDRHHDRQAEARRRCTAPRPCRAGPGSRSRCTCARRRRRLRSRRTAPRTRTRPSGTRTGRAHRCGRGPRAPRRCASAARSGRRRRPRAGRAPPLCATAWEPSIWLRMASPPACAGDERVRLPRRRRRSASPVCPGKRSRIAAATESSETSSVSAAKAPSSAAFGSGRPRCSRAMSVAGTVMQRPAAKRSDVLAEPELREACGRC